MWLETRKSPSHLFGSSKLERKKEIATPPPIPSTFLKFFQVSEPKVRIYKLKDGSTIEAPCISPLRLFTGTKQFRISLFARQERPHYRPVSAKPV